VNKSSPINTQVPSGSPAPKKTIRELTDRFRNWQTGIISVLFHVFLFFLFGSAVLIQATRSPQAFVSDGVVTQAAPEEAPPSEPAEAPADVPTEVASAAQAQSDVDTLNPVDPLSVLSTVSTTTNFQVPLTTGTASVGTFDGGSKTGRNGGGPGTGGVKGGGPPKTLDSPFGNPDPTDLALEGRLFDFKRSNNGTDQTSGEMEKILASFLDGGWNFDSLNSVYEVPDTKLYTTQIITPYISAGAAPSAFGVEKTMGPSYWAVIYTGTVVPPRDGRYRFAGVADDILAVAVNGKTVLIGCVNNSTFASTTSWKQPNDPKDKYLPSPAGPVVYGDWMDLKADEPITLQVLVSEVPGGGFAAWLLWERENAKYPQWPDGTPQLPVFQMSKLPDLPRMDLPPLSWGKEYWAPRPNP